MLSTNEFKETFMKIKEEITNHNKINSSEPTLPIDLSKERTYNLNLTTSLNYVKDFFEEKFTECKNIFHGLDTLGFSVFIEKCEYTIYKEKETVFEKGNDCLHYYFLVFGDIVLYSESKDDINSKLLKTISDGLVFGHKVKDKLQYYAYAQSNSVQLLKILKEEFNDIFDQMNERKIKTKVNFLKKHFPKFRTQSEESIKSLKEYFFKFEYLKGSKLIIDGEFDEYIYLILKGKCCAIKKVKKINGLKNMLVDHNLAEMTHVILEEYCKFLIII